MKHARNVVAIALVFEAALGLAGAALCAWQNVPLAPRLAPTPWAALRTTAATAPMLLLLVYVTRSQWPPIVDLRTRVEQLVAEVFHDVGWLALAAISIAAGVGEELLFRGALQPIAERWWGPALGLLAGSLLFGLAHAVTRTYFLFATAVGLYLGWLAQISDELLTPIAVHAIYDFAALAVLQQAARRLKSSEGVSRRVIVEESTALP